MSVSAVFSCEINPSSPNRNAIGAQVQQILSPRWNGWAVPRHMASLRLADKGDFSAMTAALQSLAASEPGSLLFRAAGWVDGSPDAVSAGPSHVPVFGLAPDLDVPFTPRKVQTRELLDAFCAVVPPSVRKKRAKRRPARGGGRGGGGASGRGRGGRGRR